VNGEDGETSVVGLSLEGEVHLWKVGDDMTKEDMCMETKVVE
jgi:hypothetical protein